MDEPTAGMAPRERMELMQLTAEIVHERSIAVLFTEHDMDVVFAHADRIMVLDRGELISEGPPMAVRCEQESPGDLPWQRRRAWRRNLMIEATGTPVLELTGVDTFYGRAQILSDVSLQVRRSEVVALLGRNGAGKSTTIKSIIGLVRPAKGEISFEGKPIQGLEPFQISRLGLGYVPEDRRVFTGLTLAENLEVGRQPRRENAPEWTHDKLFALFPNLAEMSGRLGGLMSGGEQQMLTIARTLMGNPTTMLLDEPSEGLAPVIVEQVAKTILDLKAQGLSILLSEQNLHLSTLVSDRAYIIEKGRIRYEGSMAELAENEEIRAAYLMV